MEVIDEATKKKVLQKYGINENQLPRFKSNDPVVKALNAKVGDVVKIDRVDTTGSYTAYRIVVAK